MASSGRSSGTAGARTRTLADVHSDGSAVNTAAETTLAALAVPADAAAGDVIHLVLVGDLLNNTGGAVTYTFRFYIGATVVAVSNTLSIATATTRRSWRFDVDVDIVAANDQRLSLDGLIGGVGPFVLGTASSSGTARGTAAEDLTAGKTVAMSVQMNTANALADCVLHEAIAEVIRA